MSESGAIALHLQSEIAYYLGEAMHAGLKSGDRDLPGSSIWLGRMVSAADI